MKKATAAVIVSALVIVLGGTTALAFGHSDQTGYRSTVDRTADMVYNQNCNYEYGHQCTDTDNDGICDYCTRETDSNGICDYCRHSHSTSGSSRQYDMVSGRNGNGYHCISGSSCDGTGHHAGHGYGHR